MDKNIIEYDFSYYQRTIEKTYKDYYKKVFMISAIILVIQFAVLLYTGRVVLMDYLIILMLVIGLGFIVKKYREFPVFFEKAQEVNELSLISEDAKHYYIEAENLKFMKKGSRNLTSQKRGMTFFIGLKPWSFNQPVYIRYYDMLEITYTDKFKQGKHQVSFTKSRWKYRLRSWLAGLPMMLVLFYIVFFRLSFIWSFLSNILRSLF